MEDVDFNERNNVAFFLKTVTISLLKLINFLGRQLDYGFLFSILIGKLYTFP